MARYKFYMMMMMMMILSTMTTVWCLYIASSQTDSDIYTVTIQPVTTLRTSAGKVTFCDLVLPAALPFHQPSIDADAGTKCS